MPNFQGGQYEPFHKTISFQGQAEELFEQALVLFV